MSSQNVSSTLSSPSIDTQHEFDYLIIIDFEATCDNGEHPTISLSRNNQEMIEFPFVCVQILDPSEIDQSDPNPQYTRITHKEQHYVTPEYTSKLTPFCTQLTGITDETIKLYGKSVREAIHQFDNFIETEMQNKRFCILTDGEWDLKQLLIRESKNKNIPLKSHFFKFFDMKKEYKKCFPNAQIRSLASMVEHSGIQFVGRHHSGIDDCMTLVQLINVLMRNGHKFKDPCIIDEYYDPFRDASFCNFYQRTNSPSVQEQYHQLPVHNERVWSHYAPYQYVQQSHGYYTYSSYVMQYPQPSSKRPTRARPNTATKRAKGKGSAKARMDIHSNGIALSESQK